MREEANIVEQYADADTSGRIDILIKYYPNFLRLVEGYEQSLSYIIKQEKEYKHRASRGDLGVRVQTSGISDPTAREAIDNIMIMDAIRSGDLKSIIKDLDEEVMQLHETEVRTLRNMKEDFSIFKNSFFYLEPESAELFEKYLMTCRRVERLATELDIPTEALKQQVHRMKRVVVEQTSGVLNRKYQFMGGMQKCHTAE